MRRVVILFQKWNTKNNGNIPVQCSPRIILWVNFKGILPLVLKEDSDILSVTSSIAVSPSKKLIQNLTAFHGLQYREETLITS